MINIGSYIGEIYVGSNPIEQVYLGSTLIWEKGGPDYIPFEDATVHTICATRWGDYNETVITDNGDNTVNIVVTFKSMLNTTLKKSKIISSESNVDNTGGEYTPGTTKTAVGMALQQCAAVTNIGTVFKNNKSITSLKELRYFTGLTTLPANAFEGCSVLLHIEIPINITKMAFNQIRSNPKLQWIKLLPNRVIPMQGNNCLYGTNNCPVYVPDNLVDSYKTATNWSQYASRFRAMSDAPQ